MLSSSHEAGKSRSLQSDAHKPKVAQEGFGGVFGVFEVSGFKAELSEGELDPAKAHSL